jgi:hypothetical protein|uniref:Uncharacterized protein n=1 Tax=viral metagenome TaxID=1070528 RepID=A0A6C0IQN5_9ZZZZ
MPKSFSSKNEKNILQSRKLHRRAVLLQYAMNEFFCVFKTGFPPEKEKMDIYFCPLFLSVTSFFFII